MGKYVNNEYLINLQKMIKHRLEEVYLCLDSKACFATILLLGSCAECILYSIAIKYAKNNPKDWGFESLINWAFKNKIITGKTKDFLNEVKNLRNLIHIKLDCGQSDEINLDKVQYVVKNLKIVIDEIFTFLTSTIEVQNATV